MIFIRTEDNKIVYTHYMPFDETYGLGKTEDELKQDGYLVDAIPGYEGEVPEGKIPEVRYDGESFSWVMVNKPKSREEETQEKISALQTQLDATNEALLGLMAMVTTA